jgi:hypothetical protein
MKTWQLAGSDPNTKKYHRSFAREYAAICVALYLPCPGYGPVPVGH